jgi:hypothetical protein
LWSQGVNPETLPLGGWIDAGVVMLNEGADALWRRLLDDAFSADSVEEVERAFAALTAESEYRRKLADDAEQKQRAGVEGAPAHFRSVTQEQMDSALDDVRSWAGVKADPNPEGDEAQE